MKNQNVLIALIVSVAMVTSANIISSGLKTFGRSVEKAGQSIGSRGFAHIPSKLWLDFGELKVANAGGGGQAFRIETSEQDQP